jgi:hypothetical protein
MQNALEDGRYIEAIQNVPLISPASATDQGV